MPNTHNGPTRYIDPHTGALVEMDAETAAKLRWPEFTGDLAEYKRVAAATTKPAAPWEPDGA